MYGLRSLISSINTEQTVNTASTQQYYRYKPETNTPKIASQDAVPLSTCFRSYSRRSLCCYSYRRSCSSCECCCLVSLLNSPSQNHNLLIACPYNAHPQLTYSSAPATSLPSKLRRAGNTPSGARRENALILHGLMTLIVSLSGLQPTSQTAGSTPLLAAKANMSLFPTRGRPGKALLRALSATLPPLRPSRKFETRY